MPQINIETPVPVNLSVHCKQCGKPLDIIILSDPSKQALSIGVTPGHVCPKIIVEDFTKTTQIIKEEK